MSEGETESLALPHTPNVTQYRWMATHALKLYADTGRVRIIRDGGSGGALLASLTLSGYLVDSSPPQ